MKALLPVPVFDAISRHLQECGRSAHRDWVVNEAHEDALTGAAFADFRTRRTRRLYVNGQEWLWRVTTRKFGSGGRSSEEKLTGADGIIEIKSGTKQPDRSRGRLFLSKQKNSGQARIRSSLRKLMGWRDWRQVLRRLSTTRRTDTPALTVNRLLPPWAIVET